MDVKASFMTYLDQLKRSNSDPSLAKGNTAAMACEGCAQKFTVFKRKKLCNICLRHFCTHCLSPQLGPHAAHSVLARLTDRRHICGTCVVLTARPLCRLQLRRLKVKDLQHYLTAQRVSTRGCVEKDDLVNLLIRHVGSSNGGAAQESVCHSHQDLSAGADGCPQPNASTRHPAPPRDFPHSPAASTFASAAASASASASASAARGSGGGFRIPSQPSGGSSVRPSAPPTPSPMDTSPTVEIVELTDDWPGDIGAEASGEAGPEPLVEEMSDSAAGASASCPTSPISHTSLGEGNTLSSSTTSLGDPNPSHSHSPSSASSPPHSNPHSPTHRQAQDGEAGTEAAGEASANTASEPHPHSSEVQSVRPAVITLNTIKSLEELQKLPIKQIKDLLMRNRVDFRGCCERTELVERATRLWVENQESKKAFEQLGATEMCKVCMDAPIECVMLECGHMATCMSCGKQLSECPLCRQYVVRVVRTFRA